MARTGSPARLLVTGFGPYPGVADNPSERLVRAIAGGAVRLPPAVSLSAHVLPTSWARAAPLLTRLLEREEPDIALHFGHAASARGFRLEEVARNRAAPMPDIDGILPPRERIEAGGPPRLYTGLALNAIMLRLRALGLESELSKNAGNYLCNNIYYLSLTHAQYADPPGRALFVHIPPGGWFERKNALIEGAGGIVRACVDD